MGDGKDRGMLVVVWPLVVAAVAVDVVVAGAAVEVAVGAQAGQSLAEIVNSRWPQ